jgi:hypothetical protein
LGDETRELYASSLAFYIKNEGLDRINTASANINMGIFYRRVADMQLTIDARRIQLLLAKKYYEEGLRIKSKIYGLSHPNTIHISSQLAEIIKELL